MEINFLNARSVIVFFCILQGAIFGALLIRRGLRKGHAADLWLAALLLVFCSSLTTPLIGFAGLYTRYQWLTYFPFHIAYAAGVFVYFYLLSLTNSDRRFRRSDLLLFVPSLIYVAFRLVLFAQSKNFKDWFDDNYYVPVASPVVFVTEFVWTSVLLFLSIKNHRRYRAWLNENFSDTEKIKFNWLRNFLHAFTTVFVLGGIFDFTDRFIIDLSYVQYFYFEIVLALLTYYLAVAGYIRLAPAAEPGFEPRMPEAAVASELLPTPLPSLGSDLERLKKNLEVLMRREKPYLEPQLTLTDLARQMGIGTGSLSQVINQGFGRNFNDFINRYRVDEVKARLKDGTGTLNLLGVALECGFNSKATFNRVFRKQTGVSPKEYQSSLEQDSNPTETAQNPSN